MGALDIGQLLASAGPSAALLVVVVVLGWLWVRAERRAERLAKQLDAERARRWRAEDSAARAKRRRGEIDAS
ncbi:hypothetical protein [Amycolatopsis jiangsuensis]|uniref:Uncharacterized protein n=1 Tax=Amycolatopsis jiangsuensis TaxID=1181879 RepID=A0A840J8L4_9PSEU|nr:hypothetical protein [Amycolatopsis jiangsuensis]MBB4689834.1 hypothetical protein [Amycolatopsis jiangsuensis]